jgi:hypothetical protein
MVFAPSSGKDDRNIAGARTPIIVEINRGFV